MFLGVVLGARLVIGMMLVDSGIASMQSRGHANNIALSPNAKKKKINLFEKEQYGQG